MTTTYLLLTWGELAQSGRRAVTKLAPARLATQTMGIWFLAASLGNLLAALLAGEMSGDDAHAMPALFMQISHRGRAALLLALFARPAPRLAQAGGLR